jgi:hypothetical protein
MSLVDPFPCKGTGDSWMLSLNFQYNWKEKLGNEFYSPMFPEYFSRCSACDYRLKTQFTANYQSMWILTIFKVKISSRVGTRSG